MYLRYKYSIISALRFVLILLIVISCRKDEPLIEESKEETITIFSINDPHAQINNFDRVSYIISEAEKEGPVIAVSAGDIFSGNPVVDFTEEKGYPMIDLMNKCGFDVAVLGNHEFDYGQEVLKKRIEQAEFEFILSNADMSGSILDQTDPSYTISAGNIDVTFLGAVQTSLTSGKYIPATHPWRVSDIVFTPFEDIADNYFSLKNDESSDLLVLLSHLGTGTDNYIANNYPFMDLIIGGHSHQRLNTIVNNIPVYQCGSYLRDLGKITLTVEDGKLLQTDFELISLSSYPFADPDITALIEDYNDVPWLEEVIGFNEEYIDKNTGLGCLYTDILMKALNADLSFENGGGIRSDLDAGDITVREIYEIDPFNNNACIYTMKVEYIKRFLQETGAGLHYAGVIIENDGIGGISIRTEDGEEIADDVELKLAINDYIPAVYENYFSNPELNGMTTAEVIIDYLKNYPETINYSGCSKYYKY